MSLKRKKVFVVQLVDSCSGKILRQELCLSRVIEESFIRVFEQYTRFGNTIRTFSKVVDINA